MCKTDSVIPVPDQPHCQKLELRHELAIPLKILLETSYSLGQLPADWKIGNITAIFKKGNKSDPSNYRPISLTSTICKIMCFYLVGNWHNEAFQEIEEEV